MPFHTEDSTIYDMNKAQTSTDNSESDKNNKKNKNSTGNKVDDSKKDTVAKGSSKTAGSKNKSKKQSNSNSKDSGNSKTVVDNLEKMDTDSQMDFESTLIHIPEEITFSANDISDVLDKVEQLGSSHADSPAKGSAAKKSKSKRTKPADPESEPSSKKRKSGKELTKDSTKVNTTLSSAPKELLSMPATLSVYDFDDSDDIVPSLLPLNGKDFSATPGSTPTKPTEFGQIDSIDNNLKNDISKAVKTQNVAQNVPKPKTNVSTPKTSKNPKSGKESELVKDSSESLFPNNKENTEAKRPKEMAKQTDNKIDQVSDPPLNMPEIEPTTSIFGYPVQKKQLRVDNSAKQNNANKNSAPLVSPKPSPQSAGSQLVSPKQPMVSPKGQPNLTSPKQTNDLSPEMVSPKLSIVSPGQGMISDNEQVSPMPKSYSKDKSPIKKRSPPDNLKVSTYSALNSVPLSDNTSSFGKLENKSSPNMTTGQSQATGVITSTKSVTPTPNNDVNKQPTNSVKQVETCVPNKTSSSSVNQLNNASVSNMPAQKLTQNSPRNSSSGSMENKFSGPPNMPTSQRPVPVSVSQNNRYSGAGQYGTEPGYGMMSNINTNRSMPNDPNHGLGTYPPNYSSESLFNSQAEKVIKSPPNVNISTLSQQKPDTSGMSKIRTNPYSVDNFVESSRDDNMRPRPNSLDTHPGMMGAAEMGNPPGDFARMQNESSPDGFSFANIGLNLQPITSTAGNYLDNSTSGPANMSSSFSFSLSSSSTTVSTSSGGLGHHQFPFFPPMLSSASNPSSSQTALPASMSNMDNNMFEQNRGNDGMNRNNTVMHPGGNNPPMQRGTDKVPPAPMADDTGNTTIKPSCSKQKLPKAPGPATIQEPFPPYTNSSSSHDNNFFHDNQMKTNVGKSPTEQMRKPPDKPMDIGPSQTRSSSQSSMQDKRNMDRSPQMMNSQSYYPPSNYPPSKSLTTPPLHHPNMMPPDDRVRNMTNRSPYEQFPPASQGYNSMGPNYSGNRFDNGPPSFSRDNSGTQPLSHTPVNSGGRKSANPPPSQASVVKPPQKQSAPPLVPMGGPQQPPPSQAPRPTPPQSHRSSTPHGSSQANHNAPQVNQSRQSKQPSRNSKTPSASSKKPKTIPPFMEVDSNLSNSIFETNRSMTPFFPMQNLSPQSRPMPHDSSSFLPGNLFGPGPRFPNSSTPMPKNTDIAPPFNTLFPPRGPQNGLGQSFLQGFGMNMNHLHGNHGNGPQLTPHTAPHMGNFNLFSDVTSQNESSLNISPIKFPTNYQGMEHNPMQHHHQYNRSHPSVMSINSILGPNHHGFDGRMNTSMAGPFHGHGHPPFIPPLNFSMHDH